MARFQNLVMTMSREALTLMPPLSGFLVIAVTLRHDNGWSRKNGLHCSLTEYSSVRQRRPCTSVSPAGIFDICSSLESETCKPPHSTTENYRQPELAQGILGSLKCGAGRIRTKYYGTFDGPRLCPHWFKPRYSAIRGGYGHRILTLQGLDCEAVTRLTVRVRDR